MSGASDQGMGLHHWSGTITIRETRDHDLRRQVVRCELDVI